jgi:hypothetical protein
MVSLNSSQDIWEGRAHILPPIRDLSPFLHSGGCDRVDARSSILYGLDGKHL